MPQERAEFLKGISTCDLKVFAGGPIHATHLPTHSANTKDFFQVPQGSLYRAAPARRTRLAKRSGRHRTGREAKFYKLTRKGRPNSKLELLNWERLSDAVALISTAD